MKRTSLPSWWPLLALGTVFLALEIFGLDRRIAQALYYDAGTGAWLGSGTGDWWAHRLLHDGGRWVVRSVAALALLTWACSFAWRGLRPHRRDAGFVALAMIASVAVVGGLKAITHVDCPWDLVGFGGHNPYVPLFAHRWNYLPHAACFPGAHSSSGFALMCFYFVWRDRSARLARWGLLAGLLVGCAFAVGQEARGAHFLSHDIASAAIVWLVQLLLYASLLRPASEIDSRQAVRGHAGGQAADNVA
jgi:membrane-associated PAP2 superfamily phosphatase